MPEKAQYGLRNSRIEAGIEEESGLARLSSLHSTGISRTEIEAVGRINVQGIEDLAIEHFHAIDVATCWLNVCCANMSSSGAGQSAIARRAGQGGYHSFE